MVGVEFEMVATMSRAMLISAVLAGLDSGCDRAPAQLEFKAVPRFTEIDVRTARDVLRRHVLRTLAGSI